MTRPFVPIPLLVLMACSNDPAEPPPPLDVAELSGTYIVVLTRETPSPRNVNHSCQQVRVVIAPPSWTVVGCTNADVKPNGATVATDSIFLNVVASPGLRSFLDPDELRPGSPKPREGGTPASCTSQLCCSAYFVERSAQSTPPRS